MIAPLPNCFSIWPSAISSALSRSTVEPSCGSVRSARGKSSWGTVRPGCDSLIGTALELHRCNLAEHPFGVKHPGRAAAAGQTAGAPDHETEDGMLQELDGKVAVITGGGSGIGASLARACAAAGMQVVVVDVNEERAAAVGRRAPGRDGGRPRRRRVRRRRACRRSPTSPSTRSARCTCSATTPASPPPGASGTSPTTNGSWLARRQRPRRRQRHPQLRAPHDRAGRGPHRQHRLRRQLRGDAPPRALLRDQARDRRALGGAALRARRHAASG